MSTTGKKSTFESMWNRVMIGLGSNLGNKKDNIISACQLIGHLGEMVQISSLYETAAWGFNSENVFYNACVEIRTELQPGALLAEIKRIEDNLGRERSSAGYADRKIDLDILFFDNLIVDTPELVIPHPRMAERKFTLFPLNELDSNFMHPKFKSTVNELLNLCLDSTQIKRID